MLGFTIKHHLEEFTCPLCGTPCYVGDKAYKDDDGKCYCSAKHCPKCKSPNFRPNNQQGESLTWLGCEQCRRNLLEVVENIL